jgi:hypothetical protein
MTWPVLLWGLAATAVLTTILYGSQALGLSRLSLTLVVGTLFTADRKWANILGAVVYAIGGWLFALLYVGGFEVVSLGTWWFGAILGILHGLFLLAVGLPVMAYVHPRMASPYDGPTSRRRLEPPGPFGLNYGRPTPVTTVVAHTLYGLILGLCFQLWAAGNP